jgi:hypothetical protein
MAALIVLSGVGMKKNPLSAQEKGSFVNLGAAVGLPSCVCSVALSACLTEYVTAKLFSATLSRT